MQVSRRVIFAVDATSSDAPDHDRESTLKCIATFLDAIQAVRESDFEPDTSFGDSYICQDIGDDHLDCYLDDLGRIVFSLSIDHETDEKNLILPAFLSVGCEPDQSNVLDWLSESLETLSALVKSAEVFPWDLLEILDDEDPVHISELPQTKALQEEASRAYQTCMAVARRELPYTYGQMGNPEGPELPVHGFFIEVLPDQTKLYVGYEDARAFLLPEEQEARPHMPLILALASHDPLCINIDAPKFIRLQHERLLNAERLDQLYDDLPSSNPCNPRSSLVARRLDHEMQSQATFDREFGPNLDDLQDGAEYPGQDLLQPSSLFSPPDQILEFYAAAMELGFDPENRQFYSAVVDETEAAQLVHRVSIISMLANLGKRLETGEAIEDISIPSLYVPIEIDRFFTSPFTSASSSERIGNAVKGFVALADYIERIGLNLLEPKGHA